MILEGVIFRNSCKFGRTTLYSSFLMSRNFLVFSGILLLLFSQRNDLFRRLLQVNNVLVPSSKQESRAKWHMHKSIEGHTSSSCSQHFSLKCQQNMQYY